MADSTTVEYLSEKVHQAYCKQYEKKNGKPYWTNGDYSLLDEEIKEFDRVTVRVILDCITSKEVVFGMFEEGSNG